ncbi:MAG: hypothetical protein A2161_22645, partial [Candidatus Schekmanbacteria bacterium RBG_13_48_7]
MSLNTQRARELLHEFDFKKLFIEELGWDHHSGEHPLNIKNEKYDIKAIAQKRGVQIFECSGCEDGKSPEYSIRKIIDKEISKIAYEHLIIFTDNTKSAQIWQWVHKQPGQPKAYREYRFDNSHSFETIIQKLNTVAFALSDEEGLDLNGVTTRLKDALDRDKVTKQFYDRFKKEKDSFEKSIKGIENSGDRDWYASIMLNRLMFVYFIEKKGFLNDDQEYLKNKLNESAAKNKKNKSSFYREFLLSFFHDGLNKMPPRGDDFDIQFGKIPYLNGGIFQVHKIENNYRNLEIPDTAFTKIFKFFDQYEWHLDYRPLRSGNEINPDVLGYIFEKYVNQKEMGAYYTKEDITEYISKNTIIPFIFDKVKEDCKIAFEGEHSVWNLLKENPDTYIYDAIKKGTDLKLPAEIAVGISDVSKRTEWNKPAPEEYALPTEIWREVVARRQHYEEVKTKLLNGQISDINDLITYNLNIRQFAQDVIENCEGPELLRAFFKAIKNISILDPTVGSGAFIFAALNILESLYEACLDRMQVFLDEDPDGESSKKYSDFRKTIAEVNQHPNMQYFIYKTIMINNLYGVDIMDEAVEICKLRLFLKLVSQIDSVENIEPLPDIDFNIKAGNTLVGFTSLDKVKKAIEYSSSGQGKLPLGDIPEILKTIENRAKGMELGFQKFKEMQIQGKIDDAEISKIKSDLKIMSTMLEEELNHYLAKEYNVDPENDAKYYKWLNSHRPFHWFIEFYGINKSGGFDVIIGNPPYIEYKKLENKYEIKSFKTEYCGNLYAFILERLLTLKNWSSRCSMIVPISGHSTDRMRPLV